MNRYFTRHFFTTPASLLPRKEIEAGNVGTVRFEIGESSIVLYDLKDGMYADTYILAENIDQAEYKAKLTVETLISLMDYSTTSASSPGTLIAIYDATEDVEKRELRRIFHIPVPERALKKSDMDTFRLIFEKFFVENLPSPVARSIGLLRKAYLEGNDINRFIFFWSGLESLNELLADKFSVLKEERFMRCSGCDKKGQLISVGIEKLFTEYLQVDKKEFSSIRQARGKLLHGHSTATDFIEEVKSYNPRLKKALITGIGLLLSLEPEAIEKIGQQNISKYNQEFRIIVKTKLTGFTPPSIDDVIKQPDVALDGNTPIERILTEDGKVTVRMRSEMKPIPREIFKDDIVIEIRADAETLIESMKIGIEQNQNR